MSLPHRRCCEYSSFYCTSYSALLFPVLHVWDRSDAASSAGVVAERDFLADAELVYNIDPVLHCIASTVPYAYPDSLVPSDALSKQHFDALVSFDAVPVTDSKPLLPSDAVALQLKPDSFEHGDAVFDKLSLWNDERDELTTPFDVVVANFFACLPVAYSQYNAGSERVPATRVAVSFVVKHSARVDLTDAIWFGGADPVQVEVQVPACFPQRESATHADADGLASCHAVWHRLARIESEQHADANADAHSFAIVGAIRSHGACRRECQRRPVCL